MKIALTTLLISILTFAIPACEKKAPENDLTEEKVVKREGQPDVVRVFDDDRMDAAISEAKSSLNKFITALEAHAPKTGGFAIKKAFVHGDGQKEFIWISEVRLADGVLEGEIGNEPVNDIGVALGETVRVKQEEVEDWMFMSEGRLTGGYTVVALVYGTEEEASYEQNMGIDWTSYEFLKLAK